jgi:predicted nucleic acid-binding protein
MIVISDTTPLISLMKIGQLDLVQRMFGEIQIPDAVFKELVSNKRFQEESRQIRESSFIKTVKVADTEAVDRLRQSTGLDIGESEAIILSDSVKANLLLMDEVKGRSVAQQMGIQLMGTVGMLMAAYKEGLLSKNEILTCIDILKNSGRHISGRLYDQLIHKLEKQ